MYKFKIIIILLIVCAIQDSFAQQDMNSVLDYTLSYRGLTRDDITIPIDFFSAAEKSPTNDSKLMLPLVRDMMINPLSSFAFLDTIMGYKDLELQGLVLRLFKDISFDNVNVEFQQYTFPKEPDKLLQVLEERYKQSGEHQKNLLKVFSDEEISFLEKNILSILEELDNDDPSNFDIFKYNRERDSSMEVTKRTMDLLSKLDRDLIYKYSLEDLSFYYQLYQFVSQNKKDLIDYFKNNGYADDHVFVSDVDGRKIAIGGIGKNVYNGDYAIIIDLGGDDVYELSHSPFMKGGFANNFSCIIDISGNDFYSSNSNYSLAGSLFSSGFIFDKAGDDTYNGKDVSLGSAIGGLGLLYDESGNDTYHGIYFTIGAASFGAGAVVDRSGNDFYIANSYGEGFGMTEGIGVIVDNTGNDSYLVDARSLDIGRYNDHYVSMCQGYGLGLRPFYAGGIGLIIEGEGNDIYNCDIFGQGGAYWYSLGAIVDKSGHDKYNGYQYAQGAGIHLAVGLLKDYDGWDFYQSDGVSQGCGHDFGFGLLYDVKGNDNYSAYSLSQGAGNADGIGMLIDESGLDGYLSKDMNNTRGYGNPRREYGSIGVFLDMSGNDFYSTAGPDSTISNTSTWGVRNDFYPEDLPSQVSGNNFKVQLDTLPPLIKRSKTRLGEEVGAFSTDDYFTMAKTIEPRFSLWQQYGFDHLIDDSIASSQYILTKLGSNDARESLVLINLSHKIETIVNNSLANRLTDYLNGKADMSQSEVSFACYIIGETRNQSGKEVLLQLTNDNNVRVRSSALNALGKIRIDTTDKAFINKVSKRLIELANENNPRKLFNKDLAYAFHNYLTEKNLDALLKLLSNKFYGARFLAGDALKDYWKAYPVKLTDEVISSLSSDKTTFQSFLNSLSEMPDESFKAVLDKVLTLDISRDEIVNMNLIDLIQNKINNTADITYVNYYNEKLNDLKGKNILKIK